MGPSLDASYTGKETDTRGFSGRLAGTSFARKDQMAKPTNPKDQAEPVERESKKPKRQSRASTVPFWRLVRPRVGLKRFLRDLWFEINRDDVTNSAAVLAYYSMLAIFPAAILFLTLLPYLGIPNLEASIITTMRRTMPTQAVELLTETVSSVVSERRGGLLSFSALGTVWAASSGIQAVMEQIHSTYNAKETRPYWKRRLIAIFLVFAGGLLVAAAFALVIVGDMIHDRLVLALGDKSLLYWFFPILQWATILLMMLSALSFLYYFGPSGRQRYRLVTPGGLLATAGFIASSLLLRTYVAHFGSYEATYGSLGAAIVLLLWLYVVGFVVLVGTEVNGLLEGYAEPRVKSTE